MNHSSNAVPPRPERSADQTRQRILDAAFQEIHRKGFQGMRLDEVLAATGLTKGALYHHFANKQALGYAVVDELLRDMMENLWVDPLDRSEDPLSALIALLEGLEESMGPMLISVGCPLNNLAQEMSPLDEGFRHRVDAVFGIWQAGLMRTLERGKAQGRIRATVDSTRTATFIMASLEGCMGLAKNAQSLDRLRECMLALVDYLHTLEMEGTPR